MRIILLVGFDRAGTSFVAGVLEHHPDVKYFCQPDNSSPLHRAQWEYWRAGDGDPASRRFLAELAEGRIDRDYVVSDWFKRFGCAEYQLEASAVNVVKSTKLHLKVRWVRQYPNIELSAVIRDPRATIASLVRNDFHRKWYGPRDYQAAVDLVQSGVLPETGLDLSPPGRSPTPLQAISYLVLLRTAVLCADLGWQSGKMVFYERAREHPGEYLCAALGLAPYDLDALKDRDYNLIGRSFEGQYHGWYCLDPAERDEIESVVRPLSAKLGYPETIPSPCENGRL